ncbi:outer membrane protein assembly factor BamB family protein [Actinocatenispora comari]|uniref:Pyrrolo-quinoline quinone repeat domain-containing protein n=1 Tax=Actinocatenispora comari TaxID=2807577 RepID=A0A8J4ADF0_9ACTN|nr:PQQ-binding-like beta-propeller repeat protein [Actinocatenispora comari]GIL29294.1 hypothetical protein NUM_45480 [Actinocatenispora comari]
MRVRMAALLGLAALLVGTATACGGPDLAIDETTASAIDVPAQVSRPDEVAWSVPATVESGTAPLAAGAGLIYGTSSSSKGLPDQVVAIDGRTGKQRWHYARRGARSSLVRLAASPDGKRLAAWFERDSQQLLVVFDAMTGTVKWHRSLGSPGDGYRSVDRMWATDNTLITHADRIAHGMFRIDGYDINSGKHLWHWRPGPDAHQFALLGSDEAAAANSMLLPVQRNDSDSLSVELVDLNDRTGTPRWRHDFVTDAQPIGPGTQVLARVEAFGQDPDRVWFSAGVIGGPQFAGAVSAADGTALYKLPTPTYGLPDTHLTVGFTPAVDVYAAQVANDRVVPASTRDPRTGKDTSWPDFTGLNAALLADGGTVLEAHRSGKRYSAVTWSLPDRKRLGSVAIPGEVNEIIAVPGAVVLYDSVARRLTGLR